MYLHAPSLTFSAFTEDIHPFYNQRIIYLKFNVLATNGYENEAYKIVIKFKKMYFN